MGFQSFSTIEFTMQFTKSFLTITMLSLACVDGMTIRIQPMAAGSDSFELDVDPHYDTIRMVKDKIAAARRADKTACTVIEPAKMDLHLQKLIHSEGTTHVVDHFTFDFDADMHLHDYDVFPGHYEPRTIFLQEKDGDRRRLGNQRLVNRFIRESIRCQDS